jgi:hypothetical protein
MDQFCYIKQYLKSVSHFLKTSKGMFLRDLKQLKALKYSKDVRYD